MYKNSAAGSLAAITLFITVIIVVSYHGYSNRVFTSGKQTVTVDAPEKAYAVWRQKGVKGRTLLLFDNYPHMRGRFNYAGEPLLEPTNLVEFSIFENIVRKIYFIVPDAAWEDFLGRKTTRPIKAISGLAKGVFLYNLNGTPMIATTPSSLPHVSERALVYINSSIFDPIEVEELLGQREIASDIIVIYRDNRK